MLRVWTDRSRIETFQRCNRLRWLEYAEAGMGLTGARKPLPLAVGGSVHEGLAELLRGKDEEVAVAVALADFAQHQAQLDVGEEQHEMTRQLNEVLKAEDAELAAQAAATIKKGRSEFEQYLWEEQSALVEGLVRAYARRRLRPLLEQYEVLEVEREGSWLLSQWDDIPYNDEVPPSTSQQLWFMSRPDALLLERDSKQLYILSFKTAAKWDRRKAEDAKRDMQGLSEGVEVEKRLAGWWHDLHGKEWDGLRLPCLPGNERTVAYLRACTAPPRIMGIRYEYLLKGERWSDKQLTERLGLEVRSQRSPLVGAYLNQGMAAGDEQFNVSWDYVKEDGSTSKLYYKNWKWAPVHEHLSTKEWVDKLDAMTMTVGEENREMGFGGPAQATGFLATHPLDDIFIPPIVLYRNDDELRDWIEQVEAQEVRVAEAVAQVRAASDEGEKRHLLNVLFPMSRRACEYPTTCNMVAVCFGGEDIRRAPLESGLYKIRQANHPQEVSHD